MDRLSKPTAASLSKARPPAVAASTSTSRTTIAKTKAAPTTPKDKAIAREPATHTVALLGQNGSCVILEDNVIEAEVPSVSDTAEGVVLSDEGALSGDADPTLVSSPAAPKEETVVEEVQKDSTSGVGASEPVSNDLLEHKPTNDLEDIVNLLESAPLTKSESGNIPDDILEIPDEEERRQ